MLATVQIDKVSIYILQIERLKNYINYLLHNYFNFFIQKCLAIKNNLNKIHYYCSYKGKNMPWKLSAFIIKYIK